MVALLLSHTKRKQIRNPEASASLLCHAPCIQFRPDNRQPSSLSVVDGCKETERLLYSSPPSEIVFLLSYVNVWSRK